MKKLTGALKGRNPLSPKKEDRRQSIATIAELRDNAGKSETKPPAPTASVREQKVTITLSVRCLWLQRQKQVQETPEAIEAKKLKFKLEAERTRKLLEGGLSEKIEKIIQVPFGIAS